MCNGLSLSSLWRSQPHASHWSGITFGVWQSGPFCSSRGFLGAWGAWDAWTYGPTKSSGECWLWIKTSGSFYHHFTPFFPGSSCVICGPVLRIIAYSLEYLPMHLLEMEPLLYPAGTYRLFSLSFSTAAAVLSSRYGNGFLIDCPVCFLDLQFRIFFFFSLLASAKGKTFQSPCCHTLKVTFLCWCRPSLRCRFSWSSGVSFWRFWWPTIASYMRERMDLMLCIPPPGSSKTPGQLFVTHSCHHPCVDQLIGVHRLISNKMTH